MQNPVLSGAALAIDTSSIITCLADPKEARALTMGTIVGDLHGGLTFSDSVAAVLESRSRDGWMEVQAEEKVWTIIVVNR